jgi:hypothetical protein
MVTQQRGVTDYRPTANGAETVAPAQQARTLPRLVVAALAVLAAAFAYVWLSGSEERAIRNLPDQPRRALFLRTLENLRTVCTTAPDNLRDFCQEQANLALRFQECDRTCQALAFRQLSRVQIPR